MRAGLFITPGLITRRFDQGLDSITRLIYDLVEDIEDLKARHTSTPQRLISAQQDEIKQLQQTIANKDAELIEAHHLNRLLQARIRELEKNLEADTISESTIKRDSHNSNQPPSLDLP